MKALQTLRENGIKSELYPDLGLSNKQQKKQWKYATARGIEFVVSSIENNQFVLKNMTTGEQVTCSLKELTNKVK